MTFAVEPETAYDCYFVNRFILEQTAAPTLPATDAAPGSGVARVGASTLVLVGLAAIVVGVLVLGSRPASPRRH